jgi:hypothetical protein
VDVWVPLIEQGVPTSAIAPKRALGKIQAGGEYAKLSRDEYEPMLDALLAQPDVKRR